MVAVAMPNPKTMAAFMTRFSQSCSLLHPLSTYLQFYADNPRDRGFAKRENDFASKVRRQRFGSIFAPPIFTPILPPLAMTIQHDWSFQLAVVVEYS
jgi:hypothetical protein